MPYRFLIKLTLLSGLIFGTSVAVAADDGADTRVQQAQVLFNKYTTLSDRYDPAVADLYADDAQIVAHRRYPTGQKRHMQLDGRQYKTLLRRVMPLARQTSDRSTYSDVDYAIEGNAVRINSTRYSVRKQYTSPHSLLVRPDINGDWLIYEETVHTRP